MAATQRATDNTANGLAHIGTNPRPAPARSGMPAEMARLATLHAEAEETARLANLLGRAPHAAGLLTLGAGLAAATAFSATQQAALAAWLVLMLIGIGAIARAYGQAIRAPFERAPLAAFADDFTALLTYAGFAWGAGAFLVLPAATGPIAAAGFAVIPAALVAGLLRTRLTALAFLAPCATLSAFAMVLRPLPGGVLAAALTVLAAGAIAAAALWADRLEGRSLPRLAGLPFA